MFYAFLVIVGLVGIGIYVALMLHLVPGAAEERLGVLEQLPPDLGKWKADDVSPEGVMAKKQGLARQVRLYHHSATSLLSGDRLVRQVRYRDAATNAIVRVEPDAVLKRKRIKR